MLYLIIKQTQQYHRKARKGLYQMLEIEKTPIMVLVCNISSNLFKQFSVNID